MRQSNGNDTGVLRIFCREVTTEADEVSATFVSSLTANLGSTGLACYGEVLTTGSFANSFTYHTTQHLLDLGDGFRTCYLLFDYLDRHLLYGLSVTLYSLDEPWTYHRAVVGNRIIEGDSRDGRYLGLIADRHPSQCGFRPVAAIGFGHTDDRCGCSDERQLQVGTDADAVQTLHEFLRTVVIVFVYQTAYSNIRRVHECVSYIHFSITAAVPVVVFHGGAIHVVHTAVTIGGFVHIERTIVQAYEDGCRLEGGTGFHQCCKRKIACFIVLSVVIER